eukprot:TRINITY_DN23503_c3_g1_i2.p1 TRINITY_DN23503_c3_g1~~TRINITY_DN23503_c3_g1_i2.p1  ORF type:complete len:493 (-),score=88.21 TRINITY_DN23503_c3_g1_i2:63-1541(-)
MSCNEALLAEQGCPLQEHSIYWPGFLEVVCAHCESLGTCEPSYELRETISAIWQILRTAGGLICRHGVLATIVIRAQFSRSQVAGFKDDGEFLPQWLPDWVHTEFNPLSSEVNALTDSDSLQHLHRPLFPFPLLLSQLSIYQNLQPVGPDNICSEYDASLFHGRRFLYPAQAEKSHCSLRRSDAQLLRVCRKRRQGGGDLFQAALPEDLLAELRMGSDAAARLLAFDPATTSGVNRPWLSKDLMDRRKRFFQLQCPGSEGSSLQSGNEAEVVFREASDRDGHNMEKYQRRVAEGGCQTAKGLWGTSWQDSQKCTLMVVAERLGFRPGELVLDWGSGCGHWLTWAKAYYDVDGLGIEATAAAADWGNRFGFGLNCALDGRNLKWIPNGLFDYVFSYAALAHLENDERCDVAHQLLMKLRPGGRAFLGWNRAHIMQPWLWFDCFRHFPGGEFEEVSDLEILEEWHLFPEDEVFARDNFLWQYPAYAVFFRRKRE